MEQDKKLLIKGSWGPREEASQQVAERWHAFAVRLRSLDPDLLGRWGWVEDSLEDFRELSLDVESLRDYLEEAGTQRRKSPPFERVAVDLGFSCNVWNGHLDSADAELWLTAGLYAEVAGLGNVVHLDLSMESEAGRRHWLGLAEEALVALAEEWEPDHGFVGTRPLLDAQDRGRREPWVGAVTYLSPGRRALAGSGLPGRIRETRHGGVVVSLLEPDTALLDVGPVVALAKQLRATGALAPTPTTRPRL